MINQSQLPDKKRLEQITIWICCHCQTPRLAGHETCDRCGKRLHDSVEYAPLLPQPTTSERCVKCGHELLPDVPLDSVGRCQVRVPTATGENADGCGCKCVFPSTGATSREPVDMTDAELRAAIDFHRAQIARYSNEGAKIWSLRVRLDGGTNEDRQRLADLHARRAATGEDEGEPERCRLCGAEFPGDAPFGSKCGCVTHSSEAAIEAAREIGELIDRWRPAAVPNAERVFAAIFSKYVDAGEVERLRGILRSQRETIKHWQHHVLITSRLLGCSAIDEDVEAAIDKLRHDSVEARANAIREAAEKVTTLRGQWDRCVEVSPRQRDLVFEALDEVTAALQSLLEKKEDVR